MPRSTPVSLKHCHQTPQLPKKLLALTGITKTIKGKQGPKKLVIPVCYLQILGCNWSSSFTHLLIFAYLVIIHTHVLSQSVEIQAKVDTCFSSNLTCSQIDHRCSESSNLSYPTTAVPNHAARMGNQLYELVKRDVFHCPEVRVMLNALLPHHANHLFAPCKSEKKQLLHGL